MDNKPETLALLGNNGESSLRNSVISDLLLYTRNPKHQFNGSFALHLRAPEGTIEAELKAYARL